MGDEEGIKAYHRSQVPPIPYEKEEGRKTGPKTGRFSVIGAWKVPGNSNETHGFHMKLVRIRRYTPGDTSARKTWERKKCCPYFEKKISRRRGEDKKRTLNVVSGTENRLRPGVSKIMGISLKKGGIDQSAE